MSEVMWIQNAGVVAAGVKEAVVGAVVALKGTNFGERVIGAVQGLAVALLASQVCNNDPAQARALYSGITANTQLKPVQGGKVVENLFSLNRALGAGPVEAIRLAFKGKIVDFTRDPGEAWCSAVQP